MKEYLFVVCVLLSHNCVAEVIFSEGFQSGSLLGWQTVGRGDHLFTGYEGNYSYRLTQQKSALRTITDIRAGSVTVFAEIAASELEAGDQCLVEVSVDNGDSWAPVVVVNDGQDDGFTFHGNQVLIPLKQPANLLLKITSKGRNHYQGAIKTRRPDFDYCWFDNLHIAAM